MADEDGCTDLRECDEQVNRLAERLASARSPEDAAIVCSAYAFARERHGEQLRESGLPYVSHPIAVTEILYELGMDTATLAAGMLHDVIEDTSAKAEDLRKAFGPEIAGLVDGLTQLSAVGEEGKSRAKPGESAEDEDERRRSETVRNADNLRRIFLAMANDLRVVVAKLADRLHNMRTLGAIADVRRRRRKAEQTLQIFAPLAHRVGIWQMKWELEDLAFKYLEPEAYERMASQVAQTRAERQTEVAEAIAILKERLAADGLPEAQISGRSKHLYSIYQKMLKQELDFSEIYDLVALRIIVNTRAECYQAQGIVSALWMPLRSMYADYIARSKSNLYQSLHLKVVGPKGKPIEVQIRTWDMHRTAEFGIAAHYAYKEKGEGGRATDQFERKLSWLRQQLFDWQADEKDAGRFLRSVVQELFHDQVFVFTPKGDVLDLPAGSSPIDFAYRIHSDVGHHAVGARVNGQMVPLTYRFKNADVAEIITRSSSQPSLDWLGFTRTAHARAKIRAHFRRLLHGENAQRGREMLQREAERLGLDTHALVRDEDLRGIAANFHVLNEEELLAGIGYGSISVSAVINRLRPAPLEPRGPVIGRERSNERTMRVTAGNVDNVEFRRSRCCLPIPGDVVLGYVSRGRGIALHRDVCPNMRFSLEHEPERVMGVEFEGGDGQVYSVDIVVEALDRTGLLAAVGTVFSEQRTNLTYVHTQVRRDHTAQILLTAEVRDVSHAARVIDGLRRMHDVINVTRAAGGTDRKR